MEKSKSDRKGYGRPSDEWLQLAERYFDGLTTEDEERRLRSFLATPEAEGGEFDELRAVMGFLTVGRMRHREKRMRRLRANLLKVAAVIGGVVFGLGVWSAWHRTGDICEMYVYGRRYTEVSQVLEQLEASMEKINYTGAENTLEEQLGGMFSVSGISEVTRKED